MGGNTQVINSSYAQNQTGGSPPLPSTPNLSSSNQALGPLNVPTTNETGVLFGNQTYPNIVCETAGSIARSVVVDGVINITPGTGATQLTIRVKDTNINGGQFGSIIAACTAGQPISVAFSIVVQGFGAPFAQTFFVSIQQTGATGNGSINNSTIICTVND